ncbi:hypothetical protein [Nocardia phage KYD2]|nr:hypothetical protein [Nocardia phage KYD2]
MKATVGRIVHYQHADGPLAAIVTAVGLGHPRGADVVTLRVFHPLAARDFVVELAERASVPTIGFWNWPPRED